LHETIGDIYRYICFLSICCVSLILVLRNLRLVSLLIVVGVVKFEELTEDPLLVL